MLIIAQPKTASTSLLKTLSLILKIKYRNGMGKYKGWQLCKEFEELQKYHDTTIKRSYKFLKGWIERKDIIYKEHILPTNDHINYIRKINKPIVIILRNPKNTMDNYKRLLNAKLSNKDKKELQIERLKKIDMKLFENDIKEFRKRWENAKLKKALLIYYNELVMCPYRICKTIVNHFGFKMPRMKKFALLKAKGNHGYNTYTGIGKKRAIKDWNNGDISN